MEEPPRRRLGILVLIGPGLLVAATGVGAGDLATGALAGIHLGVAVLWAVAVGAVLKFVLTEGLARWQIATGETLLGGAVRRLGPPAIVFFPIYLLPWTFFVGAALMSACGVTAHAMLPVFGDAATGKVVFGILHSILGVVLVLLGGYKLFEKVMSVCIGVMFVTVVATAVLLAPDWAAIGRGVFVPTIPDAGGEGLGWTVALLGGVGGTLTVLCYGYWIREEKRDGKGDLGLCRIDLGVGYAVTMLFGMAMVVIGSTVTVEGKGADLIVKLADRLEGPLGLTGRWLFLIGAWGAVFSSLLGVWQAVPYVFADFLRLLKGGGADEVSVRSRAYRGYLLAIAVVPIPALFYGFSMIQKAYAILGALFIPLLALTLLILCGRRAWVGDRFRNRTLGTIALVAALAFFGYVLWRKVG